LQSLAAAGLSEGEIQRRTDMVSRLQDDCEKLSKMMVVARSSGRGLASSIPTNQTIASPADRAALLGSSSMDRPVARVFGMAAQAKETEQTRPLDDHGVLQLQQTQMDQQDAQLSQLTSILIRQRQLGVAISNEIAEQIEMLDDLSNDVEAVGGKLSKAKRQLNRLG